MLFTDQPTRIERRKACSLCVLNIEGNCTAGGGSVDIVKKSKFPLAICPTNKWGVPILNAEAITAMKAAIEPISMSTAFAKKNILNQYHLALTGFELSETCAECSKDFLRYLKEQTQYL